MWTKTRSFAEMVGEIMNPYIKEYAELAKDYEAKKGKRETVLASYEFSDRLKEAGDKDAARDTETADHEDAETEK